MIHDHTASIVSLARATLQGVDPRQEFSSVRTATFVLLLQTLVDLGSPVMEGKVADSAAMRRDSSAASISAGSFQSVAYQRVEKPAQDVTRRESLKLSAIR